MVLNLLKVMLKEEIRIHTKLFPAIFFYLTPILLFLFSLIFSTFAIDISKLKTFVYLLFLIMGIASGAYGFQMREIYLRKFPHTNFLLYSYYALPIKNWEMGISMFLKDLIFFSLTLFLPLTFGIFHLSLFPILYSFSLFLLGNSISFLLSNLYNKKLLLILSLIFSATIIYLSIFNFFEKIFFPILLFLIYFSLSLKTIDFEYKSKNLRYRNEFSNAKDPFISKEIIDLKRSYGIFRIAFSFLIPIFLVFFLFYLFDSVGLSVNKFLFFSMMVGFLGVSSYDTLIEFDRWDFYSILPLKKSKLIRNKIKVSLIISLPIVILLTGIYTAFNILSLIIAVLSLFYVLSVIVFLIGMDLPLLFDIRRILMFAAFILPYFLILFFNLNPIYLSIFAFLSVVLLKFGIERFD